MNIFNYLIICCFSYQKQHPESKTKEDIEFEDLYESDGQRELNQIFSGQSHIMDSVKILSQKLDEVVGRQERSLSLLSNIQSTITVLGTISGVEQPPNGIIYKYLYLFINIIFNFFFFNIVQLPKLNAGKEIQDFESLINTQNVIINSIKEVRYI